MSISDELFREKIEKLTTDYPDSVRELENDAAIVQGFKTLPDMQYSMLLHLIESECENAAKGLPPKLFYEEYSRLLTIARDSLKTHNLKPNHPY